MISYSFEPDYTVTGRHYAHSLIAWDSIIAGALVAVSLGFLFALIGGAIGAGAFNPFAFERQENAIGVGGGLYAIFAQFVALQLGAYVASRSARFPDHFGGALTGLIVWALAVFVALLIATAAASALVNTNAIAAQAADTIGDIRNNVDSADLSEAEAAGDAAATLGWWAAASLFVGLAGAIAGGWLGAHHPNWHTRPRLEERVTPNLS